MQRVARSALTVFAAMTMSLAATSALAQRQGLSMDQVRSIRGEPLEVEGPVGDPPITRWVYADDILYFEHHLLLNRVTRDNRPQPVRTDGLRPHQ